MNFITKPMTYMTGYNELVNSIDNGTKSIYVHGLIKDSLGHFLYSLHVNEKKNIFIITQDDISARKLYENISCFDKDIVEIYPSSDINYYNISSLEKNNEDSRLKVVNRLFNGDKFITVASANGIQKKITKLSNYKKFSLKISEDDLINLEDIVDSLNVLQYERVSMIEGRGQFAIRGGILDIYPVQMDNPVRIELFDDEIDSMRIFDIGNQRSIENIKSFFISPARELLIDTKQRKKIVDSLCKELDKANEKFMYGVDKDYLIEKFSNILESLENNLYLPNMDLIRPFLGKSDYSTIIDYIKGNNIFFIDDIAKVYDRNNEINTLVADDFAYKIEKGEVFEAHEKILVPFREIIESIKKDTVVNSTSLMKKTRLLSPEVEIKIESLEATNFNRNLTVLADTIRNNIYNGYKIVVFADSLERAEFLRDLLADEEINAIITDDYNHDIKTGQVYILDKTLNAGFEYRNIKYLFVTHKEIYGKSKKVVKKKGKKKSTHDIINYSDLILDDFVVHENHGVGQYKGIEQIEVQGIKKDYIIIQYRGNDRLFIPTDQMDLVQKYIGGDAIRPKLNKLSGVEWKNAKIKAKKSVEAIAEDLIELYAKRSKIEGFSFSEDSEWQKEFESDFLYEETQSQLRSIDEIKKDMESTKPMDRLLCGDVGYGKTEVALRAAFKAIMDGKQVALLVPTTILAQQHYNTALERFKEYPIKIEMLSRFRTAKEQREILKDLNKGLIDFVIGTHKILSKDLKFKDLGLLIIDEEQRFGVRHKERLKNLKTNIDVLTLSATPIPRTLQMGLVGIRDMSTLDEPPEERFPINTYVIEYNPQIVKDAIEKEIDRGGQIYFVYNKIKDIEDMEVEISKLVPEAKIAIAHGRMAEKDLENIMLDFSNGDYDILLSTTIIETGMDISNVNTLIVYDADKMGLSQLYQLKGRIGRGDRTSFAYFTYEKNKSLTEISEKRLMAIKDFTEFGSGYKIAMRDLELRGAGNILGEVQSGYISAVGYDLYVKLLEETLGELKGESQLVKVSELELDIKIDAYIPSRYIEDSNEKIEIYKKIASIRNEEDYDEIVEELIDRFGDIPKAVQNIMDIALMKSYASKCGFGRIYEKGDSIELEYSEKKKLDIKELEFISINFKGKMNFEILERPIISLDFINKNIKPIIELLKVVMTFENKEQIGGNFEKQIN